MLRTLFGILAAFGLVLLVAGFTFRTTAEGRADFRFNNNTEPKTLDPHLATGEPEHRLISELFEGLTRLDAKTLKPVPGVAESWEISPDGKTYTFRIRPEARWSDGKRVTAHDFVYSFRRLLDPALGGEYAYIVYPIRLAEELNSFDALAGSVKRTIAPAFAELRRETPGALPATALQKFFAKTHAHDALRHADEDRVSGLLWQREGSISPAELDDLGRALARLEAKLLRHAAFARSHFGVDRGVFAKDERTLVVELRAPTPYFLEITAFYPTMPVPRHLLERTERPDAWFLPETIVSNGAFRLVQWEVNHRIRLERSETYWRKDQVKLRTIDAYPFDNDTTALNLYLTGALDWLPKQYPKDITEIIKKHPDFYANPGLAVYYYRLNTTRKPLNDRRVRQALNLSIDRESIVRHVLGLGQLAATSFVPPGLSDYQPPKSGIELNVERARALLAEAGYPGGQGFPKIGILFNTNQDHRKIAEVIGDQLRRNLGIEITVYNQEWQSFLETTRQLDYEIARAAWVGDYNDPNTFLDMWVTNGPNNQTGFASARYDRLIELASDPWPVITDPQRLIAELGLPEEVRNWVTLSKDSSEAASRAREKLRMVLFREAEAILVREAFPIIPIYFYVNYGLIRREVQGFHVLLERDSRTPAINLQDIHPLNALWIDRETEATR